MLPNTSRTYLRRRIATPISRPRSDAAAAMGVAGTGSRPAAGVNDPQAALLRQRVQSSPWVQQLAGGLRKSTFAGTYAPGSTMVRVKTVRDVARNRRMASIDELAPFSDSIGKSAYLPLTARGMLAAATDRTLHRAMQEIGWLRPDIVEHCSRVLRLRAIAALHRAHLELFAHKGRDPAPLDIPPPGAARGLKPSRLDLLRDEVHGRVLRQDAQWTGPSPFVVLPEPEPEPLGAPGDGRTWSVAGVLPPGGLQCIIELPCPGAMPSAQRLSTTSEAHARAVWATLQDSPDGAAPSGILGQQQPWKAVVMPGRPETHIEPTLTVAALERLYGLLPRLTPESMLLPAKKKPAPDTHAAPLQAPELRRWDTVDYDYSVTRSGPYASAQCVDGRASKRVPVYSAQDIFGRTVCTAVLPWLLHMPVSLTGSSDSVAPTLCRVGVVGLPCTTDLATQLHRISTYVSAV
ncbi:hypothetical protein H4R19_000861 [Coemansia spiralis]|nr:hypothetical protein H4R19_000861 [Coemansia spiralis]